MKGTRKGCLPRPPQHALSALCRHVLGKCLPGRAPPGGSAYTLFPFVRVDLKVREKCFLEGISIFAYCIGSFYFHDSHMTADPECDGFDYSVSNKSMGLGTFLVPGPQVTIAAANDKIALILGERCFSPFTLSTCPLISRRVSWPTVWFLSQFLKACLLPLIFGTKR